MATAQAKSPAQEVVASIAYQPITFFVRKKSVRPMLVAIQGYTPQRPGDMPLEGLQHRRDISGKFSRRIGQNRRGLVAADEEIQGELKDLQLRHAERYPDLDKDGARHQKAGEPTPVYAEDEARKPLFKKDGAGNDTEERLTVPNSYNLVDPVKYQADFEEMLNEVIAVECPGFTQDDWNKFEHLAGYITDPLMDLERDSESTAAFADRAKALRARIATLEKEAAGFEAIDKAPVALVEASESASDLETAGRSAP